MTGVADSISEDPELIQLRRRQIVAAATKLFSTQGFYKTTIKDISKLAGFSSGLVYHYVREKEDVLLLVLLEVLEGYAREIPAAMEGVTDPMERLVKSVAAYCRVVDRHRDNTVLAYRSTKSLSPEKREIVQKREVETNTIITDEIRNCMDQGLIIQVDPDVLAYQIVLLAHAWALKAWYFRARIDIEGYIRQTVMVMFTGFLTPEGSKRFQALS
jgi:AcrR family transcriptional regulator